MKYNSLEFYLASFLILIFFTDVHSQKGEIKIAFMADVHLSDVYGTLNDIGFKGILNPKNGKYGIIRSMDAQLHSTRLFNENYFVFKAALDDAAKRGIKIIALPGDFSDDGQPINIRGLNRILEEYSEKHGMSFFLTTGNHDPTRPFADKGGKPDFLGKGGKTQPIMSEMGMYDSNPDKEHHVLISEDVRELGYEEIVKGLWSHGFFPKSDYPYWETPFSDYRYEDYGLEKATRASLLENRMYQQDSNTTSFDVSYLVEPVDGIWLLALDANVYVTKVNSSEYQGTGIGYNQVLKYKRHLISWTRKVAEEAKRLNKTLIAFSHYPIVDFNDGASEEIKLLFGDSGLQSHRIPDKEVAEVFADTGLKIHLGGHMHLNDIEVHTSANGNTLTNVQVPSLAAYKPSYTIIASVSADEVLKLSTVVLDTVPKFDTFFELYHKEHEYLKSIGKQGLWKTEILTSEDYIDFTKWHLKELVRLRLMQEWPEKLKNLLLALNGDQLYVLLHSDLGFSESDFDDNIESIEQKPGWKKARGISEKELQQKGLHLKDLANWNGSDLIYDFYRIRSADTMAFDDIGANRIMQYLNLFKERKSVVVTPNKYLKELKIFSRIFLKSMNGLTTNKLEISVTKI
ncbi:MAG: metallophosphoesterase [Maribacter sp.]